MGVCTLKWPPTHTGATGHEPSGPAMTAAPLPEVLRADAAAKLERLRAAFADAGLALPSGDASATSRPKA
jgi:hypothetical protein